MTIVMGLDQHHAQITAEWLDTESGEVSRARVMPADRAGVARFLARFAGQQLEVALEATTGWRLSLIHISEPTTRTTRARPWPTPRSGRHPAHAIFARKGAASSPDRAQSRADPAHASSICRAGAESAAGFEPATLGL